ncbi:unnamed protein product [Clonostachys rosea f. rosea IK726]|jgi:hypothetical protein|uniref:Uncharacterized protein n=1 Tax=Clonostachys rosea f. rosea IK726 TaxID=1349383 RepID=A0ACA9TRS1_BIOOC|nr:unnamed protein product [Clonostachys rosea f. rosea IK726]
MAKLAATAAPTEIPAICPLVREGELPPAPESSDVPVPVGGTAAPVDDVVETELVSVDEAVEEVWVVGVSEDVPEDEPEAELELELDSEDVDEVLPELRPEDDQLVGDGFVSVIKVVGRV